MNRLKPENAQQLEDTVKWALSSGSTLEILGSGSKKALGREVDCSCQLDLSGLRGITLYEPAELVLSARAGTPLQEVIETLRAENQYLAFEPLDYGPLLKGQSDTGTVGGMIASNLSGPRRLKAGAARDHFLGFSAVSGRGETFKSGGRVVKNVTGYDLMKLLAGSFGTLAVMSDVTFKVLPAPPEEKSYLLAGLSDAEASRAMILALNSACEVSSAAHVPVSVARDLKGCAGEKSVTAFRLEGHAPSVRYRLDRLEKLLESFGKGRITATTESRVLWSSLRDATPLQDEGSSLHSIWRVSVSPAQGWRYVEALNLGPEERCFYDWGGGLIWLSLKGGNNAVKVRELLEKISGHASLVRAPVDAPDRKIPTQPLGAGEHLLFKRIKQNFDPEGILNPGRLYDDL
ncbi:FAD-binding protein [Kiloniella laminariae]|uniref:FAD-binding protein n=1 Tax=Kiloniella laminariae TaxID=454162 RepID=A0ABT4LIF2_9PROT|nr:FAD-binding protein [Kiloniella laminariae]MCZ4280874.1 FAD-binding protein [Kiloniella laminariae]